MRNKLTIITLSLSALAFGACANYGETPAAKGVFSLDVRMGEPVSRAVMSQEELLSSAKVSIYKGDFSGKVREYEYSQMPQAIYLMIIALTLSPERLSRRILRRRLGSRKVTRDLPM